MRPSTTDTADDVTENNEFQLNQRTKLKEYIDRVKEGQNDTYYITGESVA